MEDKTKRPARRGARITPASLATFRFKGGETMSLPAIEIERRHLESAIAAWKSDDPQMQALGNVMLDKFAERSLLARIQTFLSREGGAAVRKLSPEQEDAVMKAYRSDPKRGRIKELARTHDVDPKTISRCIDKHKQK